MRYLQPKYPNVYCLRFNKPFAVSPSQFQEWHSDNHSAEMISKKQYLEARELQLQKGKTICLSTYCNTELTKHNNGYCDTCEDFQKLEYEVN
jgi:hypothetical protein